MPGQHVDITNPAQNSTVGRLLQVSGRIQQAGGHVGSVDIQFGDGGPTVSATSPPRGVFQWSWQGLVPNNIRPGQPFRIIVNTTGESAIRDPHEPGGFIVEEVDGQAIVNVVLENVMPILTVNGALQAPFFQSPIVVTQLPYAFILNVTVSEGNGFPYEPQVQYQIGDGPLTDLPGPQKTWSVPFSFQPGTYPITVRATDAFGSVTISQQTLTVLLFQMPATIDPNAEKTLAGVPTTSSITTWTRLEPQCSNADIGATTSARLFDPLWLMTRQ
jgi:hypothetical protein